MMKGIKTTHELYSQALNRYVDGAENLNEKWITIKYVCAMIEAGKLQKNINNYFYYFLTNFNTYLRTNLFRAIFNHIELIFLP